MNAIYNIWQPADSTQLEKHFLNMRFGDDKDTFIGELQMLIYSRDTDEARNLVRDIRKCLIKTYHFKIIGTVEFATVLSEDMESSKKLSIQTGFYCRKAGKIVFETFIGDFRMVEYFELGTNSVTTIETGKGKAILQELDFIILKNEKVYLEQFGILMIKTKRTFNSLNIDNINLLGHLPAANINARIKPGDTLVIEQNMLPNIEATFHKAGIKHETFKYTIGQSTFIEIVVKHSS